jgi:DNA polymerase III subunit epsilon
VSALIPGPWPNAVEEMADAVGRHADYRVLRRLPVMDRHDVRGSRPGMLHGCALDVETTGRDPERDAIIELAVQRFTATPDGAIVVTGAPRSWLEDPQRPILPEIQRLTGLTWPDLAGRRILDAEAASIIADADFVVAHNAAFDRPFVERRLPHAAGRPWICSLRDVDWRVHGFEGGRLGDLLSQAGWFFDAHRAAGDVNALLHLLDHPLPGGGTVLKAAIEKASAPGWLVEAEDAPFGAKGKLAARGYRWNAKARLWGREVRGGELGEECDWLAAEVYEPGGRPRFRLITWEHRYAAG